MRQADESLMVVGLAPQHEEDHEVQHLGVQIALGEESPGPQGQSPIRSEQLRAYTPRWTDSCRTRRDQRQGDAGHENDHPLEKLAGSGQSQIRHCILVSGTEAAGAVGQRGSRR